MVKLGRRAGDEALRRAGIVCMDPRRGGLPPSASRTRFNCGLL